MLNKKGLIGFPIKRHNKLFWYFICSLISIFLFLSTNMSASAYSLDYWVSRNSTTSNTLLGVTYGNGKFVAVGGWGGTILTSTDGEEWMQQNSGTYGVLLDVNYVNNTFVSVGAPRTILTSPNGIDWTLRDSGSSYYWFHDVTYGANKYVVGGYGFIMTSADLIQWTSQDFGTEIYDIVYAKDMFVAVGGWGGTVLTSPDGTI